MAEERSHIIIVNGEAHDFSGGSLRALIADFGIDPDRRGVAVALNGEAVPRAAWDATRPGPGDKIEIVQPLAGG